MPKVAEWILSLVASPDRAASTVGDLLKEASRGALRFWTRVLRTTFALLWRGLTADPKRMIGLAFRGFLFELAVILLLAIGGGFVGFFARLYWDPTGKLDVPPAAVVTLITVLAYVIGGGLAPFQIGRWQAGRSPGQELVSCLALTILNVIIWTLFGAIWLALRTKPRALVYGLMAGLAEYLVLQIPILAGAVWVRRKRLSH